MIPFLSTLSTMTSSRGLVLCGPVGGGWGTAASSPVGIVGLIVMKITSKTSRMSMNGVTLMSALGSILRRLFFMVSPLFASCSDMHVGAGFMPAFKFHQKSFRFYLTAGIKPAPTTLLTDAGSVGIVP